MSEMLWSRRVAQLLRRQLSWTDFDGLWEKRSEAGSRLVGSRSLVTYGEAQASLGLSACGDFLSPDICLRHEQEGQQRRGEGVEHYSSLPRLQVPFFFFSKFDQAELGCVIYK